MRFLLRLGATSSHMFPPSLNTFPLFLFLPRYTFFVHGLDPLGPSSTHYSIPLLSTRLRLVRIDKLIDLAIR
ncbi:hypothetical protein BJX76DRAFT_62387 [Aspergillus varians]